MAEGEILLVDCRRSLPSGIGPADCARSLEEAFPDVGVEVVAAPDRIGRRDGLECVVTGRPFSKGCLDLLERLQTDEEVPVVYLAASETESIPAGAFDAGLADCLHLQSSEDPTGTLCRTVGELLDDRVGTSGDRDYATPPDEYTYRDLIEDIPDPVYMLDEEGSLEMVNEALIREGGYDRESLVGSHITELISMEDFERGVEVIVDLLSSGGKTSETFDLEIEHADGTVREYEDHLTAIPDEDGMLERSIGIVRDIQERKERERELSQYETIVETVPDGVFVFDETTEIIDGNERGASLIGMDYEDVIGMRTNKLIAEGVLSQELAEESADVLPELLSSDSPKETATIEFTADPPDGNRERTLQARLALRPYEEEYRGVIGVMRDVTERRERLEELERFETLVQVIPDPVYAIDENGYFTFMNRAGIEKYASDPAAIERAIADRSIHITEVVAEDDVEKFEEASRRMLSEEYQQTTATIEHAAVTFDGRRFPAENHYSLIYPERELTGAAGIQRDISDRKQRRQRLEVLDRVLRHNLRNQLTTVIGAADTVATRLRETHHDEEYATLAEQATAAATDLVEMSDKIRQIQTALEHDRIDLRSVDAVGVVARVTERLRAEYPDATIELDLPERAYVEAGDALGIAVENLIENAIVHNDGHPTVSVTVIEEDTDRGEWYQIRIADDGPGIPEQERIAVEDDAELTPLQHGSGIGLWAVSWIVQSFDGRIDIDVDDSGTVVTVGLRGSS